MNRRSFLKRAALGLGLAAAGAMAPAAPTVEAAAPTLVPGAKVVLTGKLTSIAPKDDIEVLDVSRDFKIMRALPSAPSMADPLGMPGLASYRARCGTCERHWGQWEQFHDAALVPPLASIQEMAAWTLGKEGWLTGGTRMTCPSCARGFNVNLPEPLKDGLAPDPSRWHSVAAIGRAVEQANERSLGYVTVYDRVSNLWMAVPYRHYFGEVS